MKILGIYWGLPSTVSLYDEGKVIAAVSEERFSRQKNDGVIPSEAIKFCLKSAGISINEIDKVALASFYGQGIGDTISKKWEWSVDDYIKEQKERWWPLFYGNPQDSKNQIEIFKDRLDFDQYPSEYLKKNYLSKDESQFHKDRKPLLAKFLDIDVNKVEVIEHHRGHAAYSYYASPFRGEPILALTVDGWGDGLNATAGTIDAHGKYVRFFETDQCNIGRIYRYITLLLGMKPNEHEFKVMGLAPYGKEKYSKKAIELFNSTLCVDGLEFQWKVKPTDSYFWFKERLDGMRFDSIAFALQSWTENLLCKWVKNAVEKSGIKKIVISGGVAMNIKAMGKVAEMDCVDDLFIGGSSSDESLAIGSAICLAEDLTPKNGNSWDAKEVSFPDSLYLGPKATKKDENNVISRIQNNTEFKIIEQPSHQETAELLAQGKVIARCAGRMEFGARALGNRSILADPRELRIKDKINAMIKNRDFWMPFAPIVLDSYVERYLINPKGIHSPHMTIGFETTSEGFDSMIAACHPADKTARPQILTRDVNPCIYDLIKAFEEHTGCGAILNTSFNLHGYPIVNTPNDAFDVLTKSGLDGLLLSNYLILKVH